MHMCIYWEAAGWTSFLVADRLDCPVAFVAFFAAIIFASLLKKAADFLVLSSVGLSPLLFFWALATRTCFLSAVLFAPLSWLAFNLALASGDSLEVLVLRRIWMVKKKKRRVSFLLHYNHAKHPQSKLAPPLHTSIRHQQLYYEYTRTFTTPTHSQKNPIHTKVLRVAALKRSKSPMWEAAFAANIFCPAVDLKYLWMGWALRVAVFTPLGGRPLSKGYTMGVRDTQLRGSTWRGTLR